MGRYLNPILPGCHPDPSVCRVGAEFYLVTSTFEYLPGLPIHVSTNLVDWAPLGHAIERPGQLDLAGLPGSCGLFAPTIRHDGERFFVVCTVVGPDDGSWGGRTGHFVVTAVEAAGPWSDPVWIDGVGGFDPSLTFDDGRVWLTGTQPAPNPQWPGQTDVWLVELDADSLQPVSTPIVLWQGALVGAVWAEGPHLVPRPGGGWMLVAAEGGTARDHAVCVAYADQITGPYRGDPANPRLTHRDLGEQAPIASVGHADLVDDTSGRTWATVLATRPVDGRDGLLGRQTYLVPVDWQDRRPVFATGDGRVHFVNDGPGLPDQAPRQTVFDDDFGGAGDGAGLDGAWNGVGRHPSSFARRDARPGHVRLSAGAEPGSLTAQSFLGRRLPAENVDITAVVEVPADSSGVRGGLLLRTSEQAFLEVSVDDSGAVLSRSARAGEVTALAEAPGLAGRRVELGIEVRGLSAHITIDGATLAEADLSALVPDPARGFVGVWVGPFAVGTGGGYLDVDRVTLTVHPEPRPA
ncbi:glycoside hydrolase family 43 protein [Subtercola endophyticus]|uniref:glycoside hydrolase family 43 protein n=1 Tax=Subtercola endophyticus TaxID=2895559 RepID=UPI001E5E19A5|nr:glycoside hydrolase family 43 protein [Subtercola endophyticus]UFS58632.1 glycoside hydrolase family 43 protein [Subtercola endophyticus]